MIVDLRCELENERPRQASSLQQSKINIHQSAIKPEIVAVQKLDLFAMTFGFQEH